MTLTLKGQGYIGIDQARLEQMLQYTRGLRFFAEFILSGDSSVASLSQNDTRSEVLPQNDISEGLRFFDKLRMSGTKGSE